VRRAAVMRAPQGWNLISDGGGAIADEEINQANAGVDARI